MRAPLGDFYKEKIPVRIHTSDGKDYTGLIVGLPAVQTGASYDYVVVDTAMSTLNDTEIEQTVYISLPYIVAVVPERRPTPVKRDRHGDPITED